MSNENPSLNISHTITCNFCGKYGHTETVCFRKVGFPSDNIDTCYKKHGFPPSYKFTNWTQTADLNCLVLRGLCDSVNSLCCYYLTSVCFHGQIIEYSIITRREELS